jgi:hypothetical protein
VSAKKKWKRKLRKIEDKALRKTLKAKARQSAFGFARALPKDSRD